MTARASTLGFLTLLFTLFTAAGATAQDAAGPTDEGLQVHGHWTVTVVRDGEVVERQEFENQLMGGGQTHLSWVLSRRNVPGPWIIRVEADGTGPLCADNEFAVGEDTHCTISQSAGEATATDTPESTLVVEGTETVIRDGNLTVVDTHQWFCSATTTPEACVPQGANRAQFTLKVLDTPIAVLTGDRIEVKVEISFS